VRDAGIGILHHSMDNQQKKETFDEKRYRRISRHWLSVRLFQTKESSAFLARLSVFQVLSTRRRFCKPMLKATIMQF
jgi:hypothetical protein